MTDPAPTAAPDHTERLRALAAEIEKCLQEADALELGLIGINLNDALEGVRSKLQ